MATGVRIRCNLFCVRVDTVAPGALLIAETSNDASILVLLPDGQRLLFDCHDSHTCAQGFRVPALIAKPNADTLAMFNEVKRAMQQPSFSMTPALATTTSEAEAVVPMQTDGTIHLKYALNALPPGQYSMTVQSEAETQPARRPLTWSGPGDEAQLLLPHSGIYFLQIFGGLGGERLRVMLLAVSQEHISSRQTDFEYARRTLQEWNQNFPGWPTHEWLQFFLSGLAQGQEKQRSLE